MNELLYLLKGNETMDMNEVLYLFMQNERAPLFPKKEGERRTLS